MRISTAFKSALLSLSLAGANSGNGFAQQWLTNMANIGSASAAPTVSFSGETYTLGAAGTDISGTSDQCAFVHESITNDTEIVARVDSQQNTGTQAKVGVMIRESTAANSPQVALVLTPASGAKFSYRTHSGGATTTTTVSGIAAPQWVRLIREGDYFTGFTSPNGVRWRQIGTVKFPMATNALIGIAGSSTTSGTRSTSVVSRVDFLDAARRPGVTTYNWPAGIPQSDKYQVKIIQNGVTNVSFVHITRPEDRQNYGTLGDKTIWHTHPGRTFSWANFACWGAVTIEVKKLFGSATTLGNITLSPKSYGLTPQLVDGNTIRFQMDKPQYVSVKFDVTENRVSNRPLEIKHGLMLFADPPELSAPRTNDVGVVEWDANANQTTAKVLYLLPGKTYFGPGATNANGSFSTNSTGGNFHLAASQSMYIAGGAYAWFSDWGPSPNTDTFIGGRGVVSGVKQVFGYWTPGSCCWQAFETDDGYEGVTFVDLPHHSLGFNANAVIRHVKLASWFTNQDGMRGGQNTLIEDCFLKCNDDYFYSGLFVRRNVIWPMWNGGTTQLGWGGYNNSNTRMYDTDLINPEWDHLDENEGFLDGAALWWSDKGENHLFEDIRIEGAIGRLVNINVTPESSGSTPGYLRNVTFRNVTLEKKQSTATTGLTRSYMHGLVMNGVACMLTNWLFENVKIEGEWLTGANAATHLDMEAATTTNIFFLVSAPGIPVAPYNLKATAVATNVIILGWADDSGTESAFEVRRATNFAGPWSVVGAVSSNVTAFTASNLTPATTYYFTVRATNSFGASAWSGTNNATTLALPAGPSSIYTNFDTIMSASNWKPATNPAPPHPDAMINFGSATNLPWEWDDSSGDFATVTYEINRTTTGGPGGAEVYFFGGFQFHGSVTSLRLSADVSRSTIDSQNIGNFHFSLRQGTNLFYTSSGLNNVPSVPGPVVNYDLAGLTATTLKTNGINAITGLTWASQYAGQSLNFSNGPPIEFGFRSTTTLGSSATSTLRGPQLDNFTVEVTGAAAAPAPPTLVLSPAGAGQWQLVWTGEFVLQTAPQILGPWTDVVPVASSPYLFTPAGAGSYFRLKWSGT